MPPFEGMSHWEEFLGRARTHRRDYIFFLDSNHLESGAAVVVSLLVTRPQKRGRMWMNGWTLKQVFFCPVSPRLTLTLRRSPQSSVFFNKYNFVSMLTRSSCCVSPFYPRQTQRVKKGLYFFKLRGMLEFLELRAKSWTPEVAVVVFFSFFLCCSLEVSN